MVNNKGIHFVKTLKILNYYLLIIFLSNEVV